MKEEEKHDCRNDKPLTGSTDDPVLWPVRPLSIYKSWTSRTAKGKSLYFEVFIWIGYIFGIANKFISYMNNPDKDWIFFLAWAFYFLNIAEITVDMVLYFRNVKLDKKREAEK